MERVGKGATVNTSPWTTQALRWHPVKWRQYELIGGGQTLARLGQSAFGSSDMIGEANGRVWTIKRGGWFRMHVKISETKTGVDVAILTPSDRGQQTLTLKSGRAFTWKECADGWIEEWAFFDPSGAAVAVFQPEEDGLYYEAALRISTAQLSDETALLALVGWHQLVTAREDEMS
jgi:hypothetical protein